MSRSPQRLGDYLRGEQLGVGGMGAVYRARHVSTGAEYALKLLRPDDSAELAIRFEREACAQAALSGHPNVARIHAFGAEQGWLYLVQELVPGGDLEARLRRGPLPPEEARSLVRAIGDGLAHAHAQGVLHRDLKPANVLIDPGGTPRLVDFGLSRIAGERSLTATGEVLGSPNWMAPEQALGDAVDERTDVYGLGAVLYHCLTGRPPTEGTTPVLRAVQAAVPEHLLGSGRAGADLARPQRLGAGGRVSGPLPSSVTTCAESSSARAAWAPSTEPGTRRPAPKTPSSSSRWGTTPS